MASLFSWFAGRTAKSPELKEAEASFTEVELKELHRHWREELAREAAPSSRDAGLDSRQFRHLVGPAWQRLDPLLSSQLLWAVAERASGKVQLSSLIIAKARLERLGEDASLEFTYSLLDADRNGVGHKALEAAVLSCLRLTGAGALASPPAASGGGDGNPGGATQSRVQLHVQAVCRGAMMLAADASAAGSGATDCTTVRLSYGSYREWTKRCPAVHKALSQLLAGVGATDALTGGSGAAAAAVPAGFLPLRLPAIAQLGKLPMGSTLLQPVWAWALSSRLPPAQRAEWRLLFSSQRDGKSFNTFFGRVSAAAGPTLLLVRDKGGALFGGYAPQQWAKSGVYYGDVSSFIFALQPALQVFPATGINTNYQWCGVGFSQLPGGLGFGGAANTRGHFALYIEPSLDSGMSRPIATYGNCPLASEQVFQIDTLECWLLQPPEDEQDEQRADSSSSGGSSRRGGAGGGVLGKAKEDRTIMELAGMQMHSDGLRDEPLEED